MASADKEFSEDGNFLPKGGTSKLLADPSPDSRCPICLDRFDNVAYLDRCLHRFCFSCVQEWSNSKAECPLCKRPFLSIFHSIRADDAFEEYILSPSENSSALAGERHAGSSPSPRPLSPDNGVLFEGLSDQPVRERVREIQLMLRTLASMRQASAEGTSLPRIPEEDMISFRRALYRSALRVRSIQDGGRYRDVSAEFFRRNPACLHRLAPWLHRELTVLLGARGSLVNVVQRLIMSNVTRYELDSQAFADELKPLLLNRTEHFLHEFIAFARCPFNLEGYDLHANYDCPAPSYNEENHSNLSIITSPDMAYSQGPGNWWSVTGLGQGPWDDETLGPSYSISEEARATIASPLETSESSDEDTAAQSRRTKLQTQLQADSDLDSDSSSDSCVIVGYVKPLAERTPEVVELSSDTEESPKVEQREGVKKQQPIQCHSSSDSEPSRSLSPPSPTYKEDVGSCRSCLSPAVEKTESKDEKNKCTVDLSPRDLSWSPSLGSATVCSPWNHRLSGKGKSRSPQSCSQDSRSHGHRSRRERRSRSQLKRRQSRSRDRSKHRSKRSRRRSRAQDTRESLKSQRGLLSRDSTPSREGSRSQSRGKGHDKRRSRSRDHDRYYVRDSYQSRCQWGCALCSQKVFGDDSESSGRRKTQSNVPCSRQSDSPGYRTRSLLGRRDPRSQRGLHERHCYCDGKCRSRSRSNNRSRTPSGGTERTKSERPGGKRQYKTCHLENASMGSTRLEREHEPKTSSKFSDCLKNEDSLSGNLASSETKHKKKEKRLRSLSVKVVDEGKATARHLKKKEKKQEKKHWKCHMSNSARSSPVAVTADGESSEEPEEPAPKLVVLH